MPPFGQEVRELIRATEVMQATIAQGGQLTADEREVRRLCTVELLVALRRNGRKTHVCRVDEN